MKTLKTLFFYIFFVLLSFSIQAQEIFQLARQGNLTEIQSLLSDNPDLIRHKTNRQATMLHYASDGGHKELIDYLLKQGSDIQAEDIDGDSPLHWAAFAGRKEAVRFLLQKGAAIDALNKNSQSALFYAAVRNRPDVIDLLIEEKAEILSDGQDGTLMLYTAARSGHKRLVNELLALNVDINPDRKDRNTLLHAAATGNMPDLMNTLLLNGLDPNQKNVYGTAPLHHAVAQGNPETVNILLDNNADPALKLPDGKTAVHLAVEKNHKDILNILGVKKPSDVPSLPSGKYFGQTAPGLTVQLFAPGIISTETANERDISISTDYKELFFTRNATIHQMKYQKKSWGKASPASFSKDYRSFEACFTPDNQHVYFISRRPKFEGDTNFNYEIWSVSREDDQWSNPVLLGSPFEGCYYPTFTNDWKMYYTGADQDFYYATIKNGSFQNPVKLDKNVNTDAPEYNSFISPDENYFIFTSHGWDNSFGAGDLYISFRNADGSWSRARNMGPVINSETEDYCPAVSPDGKYFFFASRRLGNEDIYWISTDIFEELKE